MRPFSDELQTLIMARYPLIWVQTYEETRLIAILSRIAAVRGKQLRAWTITEGIHDPMKGHRADPTTTDPMFALEAVNEQQTPTIYAFLDLHDHLTDPNTKDGSIIRKLRDLHDRLKSSNTSLILVSPKAEIPMELEKSIALLSMPYPDETELRDLFDRLYEDLKFRAQAEPAAERTLQVLEPAFRTNRDALVQAGRGLTLDEYENVITKCKVEKNLTVEAILTEKEQIIKKAGILEYFRTDQTLDDVGGLDNLKDWIRKAGKRYSKEAIAYGLEPPRGVLLTGPPGTGKSLSAKAIAQVLKVPLLRMDMSKIASQWYGKSTENIAKALKLAEAVAPCVLWTDEIEKMMAGEHEETARMLSVWLTHFEECDAPILRLATSNRPMNLKPEFLQRFERSFFVDLPLPHERAEIFEIHLRKRKCDPARFDLPELARATDGFVGREIVNLIKECLTTAFYEERPLTTDDLVREAEGTICTSKQKDANIDALRAHVKDWAVPASKQPNGANDGRRHVEYTE